jgi:hypothetical protein
MGHPNRTGPDWGRQQPTAAPRVTSITGRGGASIGQRVPLAAAQEQAQAIPVKQLFPFFQSLPTPDLQQISKTVEARWPQAAYAVGQTVELASFVVPAQSVYIVTDVLYYALCPSALYSGPLIALEEHQLVGIVRFELSFNQNAPMQNDMDVIDPYSLPGANTYHRSGWPLLNVPFGARRSSGFALFARSGQTVSITASVDEIPRFVITKIGAQFHGFSASESRFEEAFRRPALAALPTYDVGGDR